MEGSALYPREGGPWIHADTVLFLLYRCRVDINQVDENESTRLRRDLSAQERRVSAAAREMSMVAAFAEGGRWVHGDAVRELSRIFQLDVDKPAAVSGDTKLHWEASDGNTSMTAALLAAGADANRGNHLGETPLHQAAQKNQPLTIRLLLEANGDPNRRDHRGRTALHYAADAKTRNEHERAETFRCLIEAGCDVNCVNTLGYTPLVEALFWDRRPCLWVLLRAGATVDMDTLNCFRCRTLGASNASAFRYIDKVVAAGGYENLVRTYRRVLTGPRGCLTRYLRQRFGRDAPHDVAVLVLEFWKPPGGP